MGKRVARRAGRATACARAQMKEHRQRNVAPDADHALRCVWRGKRAAVEIRGRPNGLEVNLRGQGPRGYGSAARGLPAYESRDAGRAPPCRF